jgi:hypothetical protein
MSREQQRCNGGNERHDDENMSNRQQTDNPIERLATVSTACQNTAGRTESS